MKALLIFFALLLSSFYSFGQFSRGLVSFAQKGDYEGAELVKVGGDFYHVTSEYYSQNNASFLHFSVLDKNGDSKEVFKLPVTENLAYCKILGATFNQQSSNIIIILEELTLSGMWSSSLKFYELSVPNHVLSVQTVPFSSRIGCLSRTQIKGDSVILYAYKENDGLVRISSSMNTLSQVQIQVIDASANFSTTSVSTTKLCFDVHPSGEYVFSKSNFRLYKRDENNPVIFNDLTSLSIGAVSKITCADNSILLASGNKLNLFDFSLDTIKTTYFSGGNYFEITSLYNDFYLYSQNGSSSDFSFKKLSINLDILDEKNFLPTAKGIKFKRADNKIFFTINECGFSLLKVDTENNISNPNSGTSNPIHLAGIFDYFNKIELPDDFYGKIATNKIEAVLNGGPRVFGHSYSPSLPAPVIYDDSIQTLIYTATVGLVSSGGAALMGSLAGYYHDYDLFLPGPITEQAYQSELNVQKYSPIFHVSREMIQEHLNILQNPHPNYVPKRGIRSWPAHGDVIKGQAADLAPFVDVNNNGLYEPMLGDYPKIYGDNCFLKIISQSAEFSDGTGADWFLYVYSFECDTNEVIENTLFNKVIVIPRSKDLNDVYFNSFTDFDIGNFSDDYSGVDVDLNLIYSFNGDNYDETTGLAYGFGNNIPASGNILLKGLKKVENGTDDSFGPFENQSVNGLGFGDGIIDNEYWRLTSSVLLIGSDVFPRNMPTNYSGMYNFSKGFYADGSDKLINGIPVKQMYFGDSDPLFYSSGGVDHGNNHSEMGQGNPPGDRLVYANSGPGNFTIGDTIQYLQAYLVALDTTAPSHLKSVDKLKEYAALLQYYYSINDIGCGKTFDGIEESLGTDELKKLNHNLKLYPNPFAEQFVIDGLEGEAIVRIRDMNGRLLQEQKNVSNGQAISIGNWQGQVFLVEIESQGYTVVKKMIKK